MSKFTRLCRMSSNELWHRLRERCRIEIDRVRFHMHSNSGVDEELDVLPQNGDLSIKSYLDQAANKRFFAAATPAARERTVDFVRRHRPMWVDRTVDQAQE